MKTERNVLPNKEQPPDGSCSSFSVWLFFRILWIQSIPDDHEDAEDDHEDAGCEDEELLELRSQGGLGQSLDEDQEGDREDHSEGGEEEGGREPMAEAVEAVNKICRTTTCHKTCVASEKREQDEPGKRGVKETLVIVKKEEAEKGPGGGADQ